MSTSKNFFVNCFQTDPEKTKDIYVRVYVCLPCSLLVTLRKNKNDISGIELGKVEKDNYRSTVVSDKAGYELKILSSKIIRLLGFGSAPVQVCRPQTVFPKKTKFKSIHDRLCCCWECISVWIYPSDYGDLVYKCQRVLPFPWAWSIGVPRLPVVITSSSRDF